MLVLGFISPSRLAVEFNALFITLTSGEALHQPLHSLDGLSASKQVFTKERITFNITKFRKENAVVKSVYVKTVVDDERIIFE